MATVEVRNSSTGTMGTAAAKRTRYEKAETAYGVININGATPDAIYGDIMSLTQAPIKEVIHAAFASDAATPDKLELFRDASDVDAPIDFVVTGDASKISYVIDYIRGTGHVGAGNAGDGAQGVKLQINLLPQTPTVAYNPTAGVAISTSSIPGTTATFKGSVNPKGAAATVTFEYGTTSSYGSGPFAATTGGTIAAGSNSNVAVTYNATGLTAATLYHYRINITTAAGTVHGADNTFTTAAAA